MFGQVDVKNEEIDDDEEGVCEELGDDDDDELKLINCDMAVDRIVDERLDRNDCGNVVSLVVDDE